MGQQGRQPWHWQPKDNFKPRRAQELGVFTAYLLCALGAVSDLDLAVAVCGLPGVNAEHVECVGCV